MYIRRIVFVTFAMISCFISAQGQEMKSEKKVKPLSPQEIFAKMTGTWEGNCRTWFRPGILVDESKVTGTITALYNGTFLRHSYVGTIEGKMRRGEDLIAYNAITKKFQSAWIDDFHMNYAIMFSQGEAAERGFFVLGDYDAGEDQPKWGWRTEFYLADDDHLTITAYNITPDGSEAKAVETQYRRIKKK